MQSNKRTKYLFVIYLVVLTWVILGKMQISLTQLRSSGIRRVNLIPFSGSTDFSQLLLNMVAFVPFGIYLSMMADKTGFFRKILPIFLVSLGYEGMQYLWAIGRSDMTDVMANTLGGVVGIVLYFVFLKICKGKTVVVMQFIAAIATILAIALLGWLSFSGRYRFR